MGTTGEVQVDQAHRGYICADDNAGYSSINPIYMKYTPDTEGTTDTSKPLILQGTLLDKTATVTSHSRNSLKQPLE